MNTPPKEILKFVEENDVKFIRLTFSDISGNLKNIAIMPDELSRAFSDGIPFDASSFSGNCSDLLLFPDISTLSVLPWRPKSARVIRFFCSLKNPDGSQYSGDIRSELINYINSIRLDGYSCEMGTKCEFYLFDLNDKGEPTKNPHDHGSYLDVAPLDKCENVRREICLSLEEMGINPTTSCHKHGGGQNEIEFRENEPVTAADNMLHYKTVVKSIAAQNGLFASFMPKPLPNEHGSALSISLNLKKNGENIFSNDPEKMSHTGKCFISGVLRHIREITAFLNPITNSYNRLGIGYAPKYVNWSFDNCAQLIRIPRSTTPRIEIRSADACCNPYIAFKLILAAGMEGIKTGDCSLLEKTLKHPENPLNFQPLPSSLDEALSIARESIFVKNNLSGEIVENIFMNFTTQIQEYSLAYDKDDFEERRYFKFI
ncbi:MAG: glutamine synthetase family protein [Prevotella sp.]|nr:glutamine synthetase family protein [Prevotella sp.]